MVASWVASWVKSQIKIAGYNFGNWVFMVSPINSLVTVLSKVIESSTGLEIF